MAKAGLLARLAAAAHNLTRGSVPRARIVHTYHGHVLDGYFSPLATKVFITLERMLAKPRAQGDGQRLADLESVATIFRARGEHYRRLDLNQA